jgi:hypothetical protein
MASPEGTAWLAGCAVIWVGGAGLPAPLAAAARRARLPLAPCYGATETAAMVCALPPQRFLEGAVGCGQPLADVALRLDGATGAVEVRCGRLSPGQLVAGRLLGVDLGSHALPDATARRAAIDALIGRVKYLEPAHRLEVVHALAEAARVGPPRSEMMRSEQVSGLARQGFGIGGHTVNHPILARLDDSAALAEMGQGRERLQALVGGPVPLFAYPNGKPGTDYHASTVQLARRAGFSAAVSTSWGSATQRSDRFQLPRFTPWDRARLRFGLRLATNLRRDGEVLPLPA